MQCKFTKTGLSGMREHPNGWQWEALDSSNKVEISLCEPAQQQRATADSSADQNLRGTALTHSKGLAMINYVYLGWHAGIAAGTG